MANLFRFLNAHPEKNIAEKHLIADIYRGATHALDGDLRSLAFHTQMILLNEEIISGSKTHEQLLTSVTTILRDEKDVYAQNDFHRTFVRLPLVWGDHQLVGGILTDHPQVTASLCAVVLGEARQPAL